MLKFQLVPYAFQMNIKNSRDGALDLFQADLIPNVVNLLNTVNSFQVTDTQKTMDIEFINEFNLPGGIIGVSGLIKSGEFGYELDFKDIQSGAVKKQAQRKNDAPLYPIFFLMALSPVMPDEAIVILQKNGQQAIKTLVRRYLSRHSNLIYPHDDVTIHLSPCLTAEAFEVLKKGVLNKLLFRRKRVAREVEAREMLNNPQDVYEEHVLKAKRNRTINVTAEWLNKILEKDKTALVVQDVQYESVDAVVNVDGSSRTLTLDSSARLNENLDLLEEGVKLEEGGFPEYESTRTLALNFLSQILAAYSSR